MRKAHTPEPWAVNGGSVVDGRGNVIAHRLSWRTVDRGEERGEIDPTEADSNLHVLARAAAMLRTLRQIDSVMARVDRNEMNFGIDAPQRIRDIIAAGIGAAADVPQPTDAPAPVADPLAAVTPAAALRIVVTVSGGCLTGVYCDALARYCLVDYDNLDGVGGPGAESAIGNPADDSAYTPCDGDIDAATAERDSEVSDHESKYPDA